MELPNQIQLRLRILDQFSILYYKDLTHVNGSPPHWNIAIPITGQDLLLVSLITSQKENKISYYKSTNPTAVKSLVQLNNDIFPFLNKESVIDCNQTKLYTVDELVNIIDRDSPFKVEQTSIPAFLKKDIVTAINQSPLIEKYIKKLAISANPL